MLYFGNIILSKKKPGAVGRVTSLTTMGILWATTKQRVPYHLGVETDKYDRYIKTLFI